MGNQIHDMAPTGHGVAKNKVIVVFNHNPWPVEINEHGQMLGGREWAKVNSLDRKVRKALEKGTVLLVEQAEQVEPAAPEPKKRKKQS